MKAFVIIFGSFMGLLLFGLVSFGLMYMSYANTGNRMEQGLVAKRDDVDQVLANYGQKVQEAAQVPNMATEDLQKVMKASFEGRYGADGSKATMQWIQENYPGQVDPQLYRQIQQIVESGRNDFVIAQRGLIDQKQIYLTALGNMPGGWMMQFAGYPKLNVGFNGGKDDFKVIVTDRAADARKSGREAGPVQLRPTEK